MKKSFAVAALAVSVVTGGLAGSIAGVPTIAGAASTTADAVGWVDDVLRDLVDDGTITQDQADAVETALDDARPHQHRRGTGHGPGLEAVAGILELSEEELRVAVRDGQTLAEIAEAQGVAVDDVIEAIVDARADRLAERVDAGDLTQEEADEILARTEERVTAFVDGQRPLLPHRPRGHHRHHADVGADG